MVEETVVKVDLDGATYVLRGMTGEARLRQTAALVERKIAGVRKMCPHYSSARATMLAALQIAEEMLALQDEYQDMLDVADIGGIFAKVKKE